MLSGKNNNVVRNSSCQKKMWSGKNNKVVEKNDAVRKIIFENNIYLAFCPPLKLMPRSPISVWSPPGNAAMSAANAHAASTASYFG